MQEKRKNHNCWASWDDIANFFVAGGSADWTLKTLSPIWPSEEASFVAEDTFSLMYFSDPETVNPLAHQTPVLLNVLIVNEQDLWPT